MAFKENREKWEIMTKTKGTSFGKVFISHYEDDEYIKQSRYQAKAFEDCYLMVLNRKAFKRVEQRIIKKQLTIDCEFLKLCF